ncbi:MAG TPA: hypothetical protein DEQ09_10315 [Bacteroidales bacterium]|nr:hypothetical protein [Bacteroidales bacterium]
MENNDKKNILVCPLNWGKGHATRVQVIAGELVRRGYKVYIAAPHKYNKTFDRSAYTELVNIWSPSIYYSGFFPLFIDVFFQLPVHFIAFITDRLRLAGILRRYSIGLIISDNRFGFWSKRVYSIYITHQLRVALPRAFSFAGSFISSIHRFIVSRYDECWVPDLPGEDNLSGRLSHHCSQPSYTYYIGPLSRLFYHTPRWRGSPDPCRGISSSSSPSPRGLKAQAPLFQIRAF